MTECVEGDGWKGGGGTQGRGVSSKSLKHANS